MAGADVIFELRVLAGAEVRFEISFELTVFERWRAKVEANKVNSIWTSPNTENPDPMSGSGRSIGHWSGFSSGIRWEL